MEDWWYKLLEDLKAKEIREKRDRKKAQEYTQLNLDVYKYFGYSGPVTKIQINQYLGTSSTQKGKNNE